MHRQAFTLWLELRGYPEDGAPSPRTLTITNTAEITAVLNRRRVSKLTGTEFLLNVPVRTTIGRRSEKGTLQGCHRPVNGALTPARDAGKSVFSCAAEGYPVRWR